MSEPDIVAYAREALSYAYEHPETGHIVFDIYDPELLIGRLADEIERLRDAEVMRGRAWEIARKLDEANDASVPTYMLPGYGYGTARNLTATATDDGITIEMQCGATILAVHLSPDEWDSFRAEGDDARDAFEAGALEDPDHDHDLER